MKFQDCLERIIYPSFESIIESHKHADPPNNNGEILTIGPSHRLKLSSTDSTCEIIVQQTKEDEERMWFYGIASLGSQAINGPSSAMQNESVTGQFIENTISDLKASIEKKRRENPHL
jgi:hypothetical protein